MRVLLVNAHGADQSYGGAERYVRTLAIELSARGHHVEVLSAFPPRDESGPDTHVLHGSDWRDDRWRRLRNHLGDVIAAPWPRLREALDRARPDLIHTNNLPGIATGIWEIARRADVRIVHTLHDYQLLCPRTSLTKRDGRPCRPSPFLCGVRSRRLLRWAGGVDAVIGVSAYILGRHQGLLPAGKECVIRPALTPLGDRRLPPPNTPLTTIGYLGALTEVKGVRLMLEAGPTLAEQGFVLRIAGDGPLRREVEEADGVRYEGRIDRADLAAFVARCDAGIVPSLWDEPGPLVVGEWLASGRPVLATRRGGLAEAARGGGMISFDETTPALLDAVGRLRDEAVWRRILATVPTVEDDSDVQRWVDEHEAAYATACGVPTLA